MDATTRNQDLFVADALRQIFGINSPIYIPWGKDHDWNVSKYEGIDFLASPTELEDIPTSEFGTNIYGQITFDGGKYNMYDSKGGLYKESFGTYHLPASCITTFRRPTNLVKTEVLGSSGTVKELFGKGDWEITIRGIAFNNRLGNAVTAHEAINTLSKWADISDAIGVTGSIMRGKGITALVIDDFSVQPVVGQWDAIPFEISCISDEPIELYIE